uniref:ACT domain-containing protein ACR n=1 Tax=Arundo donax TaxID=35708 RepID=A0A0A9AB64_ARUDO
MLRRPASWLQSPPLLSRTLTATSTSSCPRTAQSWAERAYSVVTLQCRDHPKLLFDVVCTLHDMDYVIFHGTVDTTGDQAH